jgi:hypothetical protein
MKRKGAKSVLAPEPNGILAYTQLELDTPFGTSKQARLNFHSDKDKRRIPEQRTL